MMKNIAIALNPSKDKEGLILSEVLLKVKEVFKNSKVTLINSFELKSISFEENIELLIVLGGDGTILGVARDLNEKNNIPILGINIGNLGFLASIEIDNIDKALNKIKNKQYIIQNRILLKCETNINNKLEINKALNDIVISRGTLSRMAKFKVYVDKKLYYTFKGDGVIIATPTGSTAYSFSAGGPFVFPDMDVIIITPICSHTKSMQPIVLNGSSEIEIISENFNDEVFLTFDGQKSLINNDKSIIKIKKCKQNAQILLLDDYDYFKVLRKKILNNQIQCEED